MNLVFFLFSLIFSSQAWSQASVTDGVVINADSMFQDSQKKLVHLEGNVQVVFQGQHLSCDRALLDLGNQTITAKGNVILSNPQVHVEAEQIVFKYKQNRGFIHQGFVQSGQVVFAGDLIEKVDENRYIATNGEYTACETCPPGWAFSGRVIDAEIGGYARIKRPIFRIAGVPVLILPSLIVPLKSARQSGFLVPNLATSDVGGLSYSASYFWAINRSQDLTFMARWYEKRGYKLASDYRYVLSETSKGQLRNAWIKDRVLNNPEYGLQKPIDRFFVAYEHRFDMPNEFVHRADLKIVSDLRYTRDFPDELPGHGDPALENRLSLTKSSDNHYLSGEIGLYTNLLKTATVARNEDAVNRFPELRYSLKEIQIGNRGPNFAVDVNYINFARDRFSYDDLKNTGVLEPIGAGPQGEVIRDGRFDAGTDKIRTGQRVDIRPALSYPFQIFKQFDVLPILSYRETQYRFQPTSDAEAAGYSPTAARRWVQTDLRVKTEFSRIFGDLESPTANRWKHSIEPELSYSQIPWVRRPSHPFFGSFEGQQFTRQFDPISDLDIVNPTMGLQFDYHDRTYERQVVDFAVTQRLTSKYMLNGGVNYRTLALFRLSQSFDFDEARRTDKPRPWAPTYGLLDLRFDRLETYTAAAYNRYARLTNVSSRVKLKATPQNFIQVSFTRNFLFDDNMALLPNSETRILGTGIGYMHKYFDILGQVEYNAKTWETQSWTYMLNLKPPGRCWVISITQRKTLSGPTDTRASFNFNFGGESPNAAPQVN